MELPELLTRGMVWLALGGYFAGAACQLSARARPEGVRPARLLWTGGCVAYLGHVACAFHFYHDWSHAQAYRDTARQTAALTGWESGGGLYFNYLFTLAWVADVLWWWRDPAGYRRRPNWIDCAWQGFFFFMVFNGAVVFASGPIRWLGAILCAALVGLWWFNRGGKRGSATR